MPPKKGSLLDTDFLDDDEDDFSLRDDTEIDLADDKDKEDIEVDVPEKDEKKPAKKDKEDDLVIEVENDTPDKDKDRWVADDDKDGKPEEITEDDLRKYSKEVQARIKKMTARTHAERRRADDRERQLQEAIRVAGDLLKRNNQLSELVESGEKVLVGEHKSRLESQLMQAKVAYREAHEAGDVNGMASAQENIAKAAAAMDRVSTHQATPLPRISEEDFRRQFAPQRPEIDQQTQAWREKNDWFGKDTLMTGYAMSLHQELTRNRNIQPSDQAYWKTINTEMKKRFPEKFGDAPANGARRAAPVVAPAGRMGSSEARKVVLTESQVKLARRLGLTTEQYARQVMLDAKSKE
jgi:hypothetical protein